MDAPGTIIGCLMFGLFRHLNCACRLGSSVPTSSDDAICRCVGDPGRHLPWRASVRGSECHSFDIEIARNGKSTYCPSDPRNNRDWARRKALMLRSTGYVHQGRPTEAITAPTIARRVLLM